MAISISLGKKDGDLISWFLKLKEEELEQSFYIKKAIEAFLTQKPLNLGKVHLKDKSQLQPFNTSYTPSKKSDKNIIDFIIKLKKSDINVSSFIKNILKSYIIIIPPEEEEYIPSYFEFNSLLFNNNEFLLQTGDVSTRIEPTSNISVENPIDTINKNIGDANNIVSHPPQTSLNTIDSSVANNTQNTGFKEQPITKKEEDEAIKKEVPLEQKKSKRKAKNGLMKYVQMGN